MEHRDIFDGTLDEWAATGDPDAWTVDDGCIHCRGAGGGILYSYPTFEDFELRLEFRIEEGVNSGVFFRLSDLSDPVHTGLEIQVLDTHGDPQDRHSCGALYDLVAPAEDAARPAGEWNTLELVCVGPHIRERLNGTQVVDVDISRYTEAGRNPDGSENKFENAWATMPRRGHIGLQDHGGEVWFRDLRVRER